MLRQTTPPLSPLLEGNQKIEILYIKMEDGGSGKDIAKIVISEEQIRNKLLELSKTLIRDYTGKEWTIIAILNGESCLSC